MALIHPGPPAFATTVLLGGITVKRCSRCRVVKPLTEFGVERARRDGRRNYCKPCAAAHLREYRQREPERFRQYEQNRDGEDRRQRDRDRWAAGRSNEESRNRARFARKIRKMFGITLEQYDELVSKPCGICGRTENVVLDHCHTTGVIRGPLCKRCNSALGQFEDNPARLRFAAEYVELHLEAHAR